MKFRHYFTLWLFCLILTIIGLSYDFKDVKCDRHFKIVKPVHLSKSSFTE